MIYTCEDCGFIFQRTGEVTECPSCEKSHIRFATRAEEEELKQILREE